MFEVGDKVKFLYWVDDFVITEDKVLAGAKGVVKFVHPTFGQMKETYYSVDFGPDHIDDSDQDGSIMCIAAELEYDNEN